MGILGVANACSHIQNASRARLGLTSIPNNKYNLNLLLALHRAGFISSVTRGGPHPPPAEALLTFETEPVTTANVATRRLWLGLKFWNNEPVIKNIKPVSRPSRLVSASLPQLERVVRGFPAGYMKGLTLGESLFIGTPKGILDAREAVAKKTGGLVICRVS